MGDQIIIGLKFLIEALTWVLGKTIGGLLIGVSGFIGALFIYRYLHYYKIKRNEIKDGITAFLKRCNGAWEKGESYHITTKEFPRGEPIKKNIYPTTKAVTEWLRRDRPIYTHNRWGFKYDEDFVRDLLEEMRAEGFVNCIHSKDTHEVEGWVYGSGAYRFERLSLFNFNNVEIKDDLNYITISQGKMEIALDKNHIRKVDISTKKSEFFIEDLDRYISFECVYKWRAKYFKNKIQEFQSKEEWEYF
ncbi:hypothetical protein [Halobacillus sp. B29]|uniref:hypothetical protein n=1 Tax=Halobacillus sp. B29 TaxID=3457432 RepID=UPI003FCDC387